MAATTTTTGSALPIRTSSHGVPPIDTQNLHNHPNVEADLPSVDRDAFSSPPRETEGTADQQQYRPRRVTLTDEPPSAVSLTAQDNGLPPLPPPPKYHQGPAPSPHGNRSNLLKTPQISITGSRSDSNMHRAFSLRRSKSGSKAQGHSSSLSTGGGDSGKLQPAMHTRNHSMTYGDKTGALNGNSTAGAGGLQRSMSKRQKFVRAITNPDTIFKQDPSSPPPESRFAPNPNSKLARTFFGSGRVDFGAGVPLAPPTPPTPLPDPDLSLFNPGLVSEKVLADLPAGYTMRPLCRGDYHRGYMDVLRVVGRTGWVGEDIWEERCEWLRSQTSTYYILVVVNENDRICASGTVLLERKFIHNMGIVGHIEDLAVARDQKGKKMGLRVLEALVHVANSVGAYKTMVNCTEANEAFHAQTGFVREGSQMVLHHNARRTPQAEHWV